jgi:hypothetical protein
MKKKGYRRKTTFKEKNTPGLVRVIGRPARSTGFFQVVASAGLLTNLDRSSKKQMLNKVTPFKLGLLSVCKIQRLRPRLFAGK